jgi:hypothetical protein
VESVKSRPAVDGSVKSGALEPTARLIWATFQKVDSKSGKSKVEKTQRPRGTRSDGFWFSLWFYSFDVNLNDFMFLASANTRTFGHYHLHLTMQMTNSQITPQEAAITELFQKNQRTSKRSYK